jgi:hypothetical protein
MVITAKSATNFFRGWLYCLRPNRSKSYQRLSWIISTLILIDNYCVAVMDALHLGLFDEPRV